MLQSAKPCIVHTNISGNRGVDFKFLSGLVHVILAFEPKYSVDITQGIGRGNRDLKDEASSTIVVNGDNEKMKVLIK